MAAAKNAIDVYQLKFTLQRIRPPIWRRVLVPATMTLKRLHMTIQLAMGWYNSHLHEFEIGPARFGDPAWDEMGDLVNEAGVRLGDLKLAVGDKFIYTYDFGDDWRHTINVEAILSYDPDVPHYPICIKAKRACPLEDVGGFWGYEDFLKTIADPSHPEHADLLAWAGGAFDPEAVDLDEINRQLEARL